MFGLLIGVTALYAVVVVSVNKIGKTEEHSNVFKKKKENTQTFSEIFLVLKAFDELKVDFGFALS